MRFDLFRNFWASPLIPLPCLFLLSLPSLEQHQHPSVLHDTSKHMASNACFDSTIGHVSIPFFSFLNAKELASVSLSNKVLYTEARAVAFQVCMQQLPLESNEDEKCTDALTVYAGEEKLVFPDSKESFLKEIVCLLHSNEVSIEDHGGEAEQIDLARYCSFLKLIGDDGFSAHISLGFKHKSFQSRQLNMLHAHRFANDMFFDKDTEGRRLILHWIYFLTSLEYVSVGT